MSDFKEYFKERRKEVVIFVRFIEKIDRDPVYNTEIKILRSQAILMLYNLIEGVINKGIEHIFNTISDNYLKHNDASQQIRIMWLRYFKLHLDDRGQNLERLSSVNNFVNDYIDIDMAEFREINPSYFKGGSLDSRAIKKILKKFAIEFEFFEYKLQEIKNERNFLAHGEKSFIEIGQAKTVLDMNKSAAKVIRFLKRYVVEIEKYVTDESYKIN